MVRNLSVLTAFILIITACDRENKGTDDHSTLTYDEVIQHDGPSGYWLLEFEDERDATPNDLSGAFGGTLPSETELPNGENGNVFNGEDSYFEIPDADHIKLVKTGVLTIEAWMRPDVLNFERTQGTKDYLHWMGKGSPNQHSWAARLYNKDSNRPQRISGYVFNLDGGLGVGSYFQDDIAPRTWIHFVLVINTKNTSSKYPTGYTKVYRDGQLRDQDDLASYDIDPGSSSAPSRIGTRDLNGFFEGAIAKVAIYDHELSEERILFHYEMMDN